MNTRVLLGLTLRQSAGKRRLAILFVMAVLPVVLAIVLSTFLSDEADFRMGFTNTIIDGLIVGAILPLSMMTLATAAFGNEVEDRTLNVLVLKPVSRYSIVLAKYLGSVLVALPLLVAVTVAVVLIAFDDAGLKGVLATAAAIAAGTLAYAAVFTWAGLLTRYALGFAAAYVFLWEGLVTSFLEGVRYLSVRGYVLALMNGLDDETYGAIGDRVIELPAAIAGAVAVTVVFFYLTVRRLQRMDVP